MTSLLLAIAERAASTASTVSSNEDSNVLSYIAAGVVAAVGLGYFLMSNTAAPAPAAAATPAAPVRKSEPNPDPKRVWTLAQLRAYDGSDPTGPIYMATAGKVFDVTSGASFYGPGGPYGCFAGKDASRGLAKMDLKSTAYGVDDLSPSEKNTLKDWHDKFDSKYPVVGVLVDYTEPNSGPKPENGTYTGAAAQSNL